MAAPVIRMRDESSSTGQIFALPSKQYVLPARPKPGRKPTIKKAPAPVAAAEITPDSPGAESEEGGDFAGGGGGKGKGKNRLAQKAFRERKNDYVAELEERIRQYEANEVEKSLALQTLSRRLKAENTKLLADNAALKARVTELEVSSGGDPPSASSSTSTSSTRRISKQSKVENAASPISIGIPSPSSSHHSNSPPSYHSSFSNHGNPQNPSLSAPLPSTSPRNHHHNYTHSSAASSSSSSLPPAWSTSNAVEFDVAPTNNEFTHCGFCPAEGTDEGCVCKEIQSLPPPAPAGTATTLSSTKQHFFGIEPTAANGGAQPLRKRQKTTVTTIKKALWETTPLVPECTGDPSNCAACANDKAGQEFCETLKLVEEREPCENCDCGLADLVKASKEISERESGKKVSAAEAWRQFRAHPNITTANLSLLADVITRRPNCNTSNIPFVSSPLSTSSITSSSLVQEARISSSGGPRISGRGRGFQIEAEGVKRGLEMLDHAGEIGLKRKRNESGAEMMTS